MKLHELKAVEGSSTAAKRKGRGHGSGNGKTAGYGHKGQKARSGAKKAGFEGGQMPLQRRLPKRGFNNIFATQYVTVKVSDLEKFEAGSVIDAQALLDAGIIKKVLDGVKVLGNGEVTKAVTVKAAAYTASAKEKIEKTMDSIVAGFERQLDQLYQDDAMDIDSDIRVMETMLRRDSRTVEDDFGLGSAAAVQEETE